MKIAVCMSGQLRQWEIAKENQKRFWETISLITENKTFFIKMTIGVVCFIV